MAKEYNFQYTPLTGRLPGKSFVKQTEQAINELAGIVNEGSAQVEVITNLANTANDNAEEALEKANEALETAGRVYITLPNLDDADSYFDSQLYYFANSYSHNLPVQGTGFLEVKTNDTKTACEQVFIADLTGLCYFRHGTITSAEVGSETVYSVTWDIWSSALASEDYVQSELLNYLPLGGGAISGNLSVSGTITGDLTGDVTGNADTATKATNDGNGNNIASTYLPLAGGTMTGAIKGNPVTLTADDGNDSASLVLGADGSATWNGKNVLAIESSGSEYIRFTNGLQLCWHFDLVPANSPDGLKVFNFPIPFNLMRSLQITTVGVANGRFMNVACAWGGGTTNYQVQVENMASGIPIYDIYFWMFALGTWK